MFGRSNDSEIVTAEGILSCVLMSFTIIYPLPIPSHKHTFVAVADKAMIGTFGKKSRSLDRPR